MHIKLISQLKGKMYDASVIVFKFRQSPWTIIVKFSNHEEHKVKVNGSKFNNGYNKLVNSTG